MVSASAYTGKDSVGEGQGSFGRTNMEDIPIVSFPLPTTEILIPIQDKVISSMQEGFILSSGVPQLAVWPLSGIKADQILM